MIPFFVLVISFLVFALLGFLGIPHFAGWVIPLRSALALMFLLTASAHFGRRRADLIRMVPPAFGSPGLWVTLTGILELAGAAGLLIPRLAPYAAGGLALMLMAIFPANVYAARSNLSLGGKPVTPLGVRTVMQVIFLAALVAAAYVG